MTAGKVLLNSCRYMLVPFVVAVAIYPSPVVAQRKETSTERSMRLADAALANVPGKARANKNPLEGDAEAARAGGKLYDEHCSNCHGKKAGGTRHGTSLLREPVRQATPGTLFWILTNGVVRHGMPVWSKLPELERWQIVSFLQLLNTPSPQALP